MFEEKKITRQNQFLIFIVCSLFRFWQKKDIRQWYKIISSQPTTHYRRKNHNTMTKIHFPRKQKKKKNTTWINTTDERTRRILWFVIRSLFLDVIFAVKPQPYYTLFLHLICPFFLHKYVFVSQLKNFYIFYEFIICKENISLIRMERLNHSR